LKGSLRSLPAALALKVLKNGSLKLESEDELFEFCKEKFMESGWIEVFECVLFERLSSASVSSLVGEVASKAGIERLAPIIENLMRRLALPVDTRSAEFKASPSHAVSCRLAAFDSLAGHFRSLSLSLSLPLSADGSPQHCSDCGPQCALEKGQDRHFFSTNVANSWWSVDIGREVVIEAYSLTGILPKNRNYGQDRTTWEVHTSKDKQKWTLVDSQSGRNTEKPSSPIDLKTGSEFRYLRVTQTGKNIAKDD
jgi:hypothetical protein